MLTGLQIRAARALLRWSAEKLAEAADVAVTTVRRFELEDGTPSGNIRTIGAIKRTLEDHFDRYNKIIEEVYPEGTPRLVVPSLRFRRDQVPSGQLVEWLSSRRPIADLAVEEPPIERIVAAIYRHGLQRDSHPADT